MGRRGRASNWNASWVRRGVGRGWVCGWVWGWGEGCRGYASAGGVNETTKRCEPLPPGVGARAPVHEGGHSVWAVLDGRLVVPRQRVSRVVAHAVSWLMRHLWARAGGVAGGWAGGRAVGGWVGWLCGACPLMTNTQPCSAQRRLSEHGARPPIRPRSATQIGQISDPGSRLVVVLLLAGQRKPQPPRVLVASEPVISHIAVRVDKPGKRVGRKVVERCEDGARWE